MMMSEKEINSQKESLENIESADCGSTLAEAEKDAATDEQKPVYDEIILDEKGLIERDGFRMKGVNYGPEFDEKNLDRAFKFSIIAAVTMLLFVILCFFLFLNYFDRLPWQI